MKKSIFLLWFVLSAYLAIGQLSGIKNIPGSGGPNDYATLADAITALNTNGVGAGGVTFNITAGYTENTTAQLTITATGIAGNAIIFRKDPLTPGANPLITRTDAGSNSTSTLSGMGDGVIRLDGTDYITFDGIDVAASQQGIEYGYYTHKTSATNGCQNVAISNCAITMTKGTSAFVIGIYIGNGTTSVSSSTGVVVSANSGRNENITITGNTISNVHAGIYVRGASASYDQNILIGQVGVGNTIQNYGGGSTTTTYGVYFIYVNNADVSYNTIDNAGNGGSAHGSILYGVFYSTVTGVVAGSNNQFTMANSSASSATNVIYNGNAVTSNNFNNNTFAFGTLSSTGTVYIIYASSVTQSVSISGNQTSGNINRTGASGTFYCYYNNGSPTGGVETLSDNNFSNISLAGSSTFYGLYSNTAVGQSRNCYNNTISSIQGGTGSCYLIYVLSSVSNYVYNNTVMDIASGGTTYGLYFTGTNPVVYGNIVKNITTSGTTIVGVYNAGTATTQLYNNKVFNINSTNTAPIVSGVLISAGTANYVYNNYVSDLNAGVSNNDNSVRGINITGTTALATYGIYFNTIYLASTSSGTNFGATGIYHTYSATATTAVLDMRNNIIVNNSTPNGTGSIVAFRRSAATNLGNVSLDCNNNCLYAGAPGANNLIFYDGTNAQQTLGDYQTWIAPREALSFSSIPPFVDISATPYDLHIQAGVSTKCESGGNVITTPTITVDYDGNARYPNSGYPDDASSPATAPDVGADEFAGIPSFTCAAPAPGNTVSTANGLCLGQSITLSLENATIGTGVSYQWQKSVDNVTYTDISGEINAFYTFTPIISLYYQCIVTCQNGPSSAISNPIQITFSAIITSTTPASRCGTGTVNLQATGTGTAIKWYDVPSGGAPIGMGSPITTPAISTTDTFYVSTAIIANGDVNVGAGATTSATYSNPFYSLYSNIHTQHLITAAELNVAGISAGNINAVALDVTSAGTLPMLDLSVKIGTTTATALTVFADNSGFTEIYTNTSLMPVVGLNVLTFSTPFSWDGTSNIILEFCHGNGASTATMSRTVKADATSYVSSIKTHRTSSSSSAVICGDITTNLLSYSLRPKFIFNAQAGCSSPRVEVVATVTPPPAFTVTADQTICNNAVGTLAITSTIGDYDSYIWSPVTDLYTDAAATIPYTGGSAATVYVKSTIAATVSYICTANNSVSLCANINTTKVTVLPALPVIASAPDEICKSGSAVLSTTPSIGYGAATFQWQDSPNGSVYTDILLATALEYTTPVITSTTYYQLLIKDGNNNVCVTPQKTMVVNNPQILSTTPGTRCGSGTVDLSATGEVGAVLKWYTASAGGTALGSGSNFATPVINSTTSFYVSASAGSTLASIGAPDRGASSTYTSQAGLLFDVFAPSMNLNGVYIYPVGTGEGVVNIALKNSSGAILESVAFTTTATASPGVKTYVPLNWSVASGNGYWLDMTSRTGLVASLIRDGTADIVGGAIASNAFMTLPGVMTITAGRLGSSGTSTSYYYFYDWQVETGCEGDRTEVIATVTPSPAILPLNAPSAICVGQSSNLSVTSSNDPNYAYEWTPGNLAGATQTVSPATTTVYTITAIDAVTGCNTTGNITVTVNPLPSSVTASASVNTICAGGAVDLFSSAISNAFQTNTYVDPTIAGGFETGLDFASNGWTQVNSASNYWIIGNLAPAFAGSQGVHISQNGTAYDYSFVNPASNTSHFYRDVVIPASVQNISLKFYWKGFGEADWDNLLVWTAPTTFTPVADLPASATGIPTMTGATLVWTQPNATQATYTLATITLPNSLAGTTVRLIFTWQNDMADGVSPAVAIDNISLTADENVAVTYTWTSLPVGYVSSVQNPTGITPAVTTQYIVTAENINGCTASSSTTVTVDVSVGGLVTATTSPLLGGQNAELTVSGQTGSILKWQKALNGGSWSDIVSTANPYSEIPTDLGMWSYRAVIQTGSCPEANAVQADILVNANTTTFTEAIDNDWNTAGNWTNGIPTRTYNAIITSSLKAIVGQSGHECNDITVAPLGELTIVGVNFSIYGTLLLQSDVTGAASLLESGTITYANYSNAQCYVTGNKFHQIALPVSNTIEAGTAAGQIGDVFLNCTLDKYNESTNTYTGLTAADAITPDQGYMVQYMYYAPAPDYKTIYFRGTLNTGDKSFTLTSSGALLGYNLLPNPYPSSIDWDHAGLTANATATLGANAPLWIWNHTASNWGTYVAGNAGLGTNGATNIIAQQQSFFVKATTAGLFTIPSAARLHGKQSFLKSTPENLLKLKVISTINTFSDEMIVNFKNNATASQGATKWFSFVTEAPSLYSVKNNQSFAINTLTGVSNQLIVNVGFKAGENGNYTITASGLTSFATTTYVYLKDLTTNSLTDLNQNATYSFAATTNDNADRFQLIFALSPLGISNNGILNTSIYANNNIITVNSNENIQQIAIYNTLGQMIKTFANTQSAMIIDMKDYATGYYVVRVVTDKNVYSEKVLIE